MDREVINRILQCTGVGLLMGSVLFLPSCVRKDTVRRTPASAPKPDSLLGKWVMIADNGTGAAGAIADYRPDGTVIITQNGKRMTIRYRREPGKAWADRRATGRGMQGVGGALDQFRKPGVEMIEFAGSDGKFIDYGGSLLTLDPERRVLANPLTQAWCRPGEEARVKKEFEGK